MKLYYLSLVILTSFSFCVSKVENRKVENQPQLKIVEEDFTQFYNKFSKNTDFRVSRTKLPISYITIERDDDSGKEIVVSEKLISSFPIQLDKKKWKEAVSFNLELVSSDSAKVVIGIEDTGYHVEVFFIKDLKSGKWYAVKVENSSI